MKGHIDQQGQSAGEGEEEYGDHASADTVAEGVQVIDLRDEFGDGAGFGIGGHPSCT